MSHLEATTDGVDEVEMPDRETVRKALDELFIDARQYNSSKSYLELMEFIALFRLYSPFNAMLIHTQMRGAKYVAPARRWAERFGRVIKVGARPMVVLQPMGPVLFVFDVSDTEPVPGAPPLPPAVTDPFVVRSGRVDTELEKTKENAKRDGVEITEAAHGSQQAGSVRVSTPGRYIEAGPSMIGARLLRRYSLLLNSNLSRESRYATLVHELGHLYCGHLGTPDPTWWPNRRNLSHEVREFEAESVCYLVCTRLGVDNPSAEYLAGYVRRFAEAPPISLDAVMKASWLIERMGRRRLKLRTEADA